MTCGWIINLLISATAADTRLHFWPLENYSSYSRLVIQADREGKWKWQRINCNSIAFKANSSVWGTLKETHQWALNT